MAEPLVRGLIGRASVPVAAALPAIVLGIVSLGVLALAAAGAHPMWQQQPVNMSEAAALQDSATVLRMLRRGESLRAVRPVRAGVLSPATVMVTPLEAAIAARRAEVVEILMWSAEGVDPETWTRLRCLAASASDEDVARVLDQYKPAAAGSNCAGVVRPW